MPSVTRKQALINMSFGQRIAEEEERELAKYFVETEQWRQISNGRVDIAFAESAEFEANALRALFKVYLDMLSRERIQLKIFLRSDIWKRIIKDRGFRGSKSYNEAYDD